MPALLRDVARFDYGRLFDGAVSLDWLTSDPEKARQAALAYVFHGPSYHGVAQREVSAGGHRLVDSVSFFRAILDRVSSDVGQPFVLAIAGYGSGKSHMAITLAQLIDGNDEGLRDQILSHMADADAEMAAQIRGKLPAMANRVLLVAINGMNNFDLATEVSRQIRSKLIQHGISTEHIDALKERFLTACRMLDNLDAAVYSELLVELGLSDKSALIDRLSAFDEIAYSALSRLLETRGIPLKAIGSETVKDILAVVAENYVGDDNPFSKLLLIFDEFGRYTEFATTQPHIAGSGCLQHLFEGVQDNSKKVTLVGFIQYELKLYEQRISSVFRNEIRRFITRFESAEKYYLSINLETLIAHLVVKNVKDGGVWLSRKDSSFENIHKWFPSSVNHAVWSDQDMFNRVIQSGCYPLSPLTVWLLFHLSAGGQYLQQRSALSLLKAAFDLNQDFEFSTDFPVLPPVALWTVALKSELEDVEEKFGRGSVVQAYDSVIERSGQHLNEVEHIVLKSVVLVALAQLKASSRQDAFVALMSFSGLPDGEFRTALSRLENEFNVISWDDSFHMFDILADSASKSQFVKYLRQRLEQEYDLERRAGLFFKCSQYIPDVLKDRSPVFAEARCVSTPEWRYEAKFVDWETLKGSISSFVSSLRGLDNHSSVELARGVVIYCYVAPTENEEVILTEARRLLRAAMREGSKEEVPLVITLIFDRDGIGQNLAELDILAGMPEEAAENFGRFVGPHVSKTKDQLANKIKQCLLERKYVTTFPEEKSWPLLDAACDALFEHLFPRVLSFPFDGYSTSRGNAAKDCKAFTRELLAAHFEFDAVKTKEVSQKNRITTLLRDTWKVVGKDGKILLLAGDPVAKAIESQWEKTIQVNGVLNCRDAVEFACGQPFGASVASAGLLLGVFIQARRDNLYFVFEGKVDEFSTIVDSIWGGNELSVKALARLDVRRAESVGSEWRDLLDEWESQALHLDLIRCLERSEELASRLPVPTELKYRYLHLSEVARKSKAKIEATDNREKELLQGLESAQRRRDVVKMVDWILALNELSLELSKDERWQTDEVDDMREKLVESCQSVIQILPLWLREQRPTARTPDALADLKIRLVVGMAGKLKKLRLQELAELVEKYYADVARSFDVEIEATRLIDQLSRWLETNQGSVSNANIGQIRTTITTIDGYERSIAGCKAKLRNTSQNILMNQVEALASALSDTKKSLRLREKEVLSLLGKISNEELRSDKVAALMEEIVRAERLMDGADDEQLKRLGAMKAVVQTFLRIKDELSSLHVSVSDYPLRVQGARVMLSGSFAESEVTWDVPKCFDALVREADQHRSEAAIAWLEEISDEASGLATMTTQEARDLLRTISNPPPYFSGEGLQSQLLRLRGSAESYLEGKGVEWLFEKYLELSPSGRKSFKTLIDGRD